MGVVIIIVMLGTYRVGTQYLEAPEMALIVTITTAVLLVLSFVINRSFERLVEASRMKSEFVSIVSHQLRAPLSNLKLVIELLMSGKINKVDEKQLEYFKILKGNANRMKEIVNDLLIVSRIEQGALPLKKIEIQLEDLIKNLILEFKPFTKALNTEIDFKFQKGTSQVFADPSRIKVVIENLIDNAVRYLMPLMDNISNGAEDKRKVEILLEKRRQKIYFEIKDNGVGIPKTDQKYIFQKFFRSENILKYQTQGSGLGLFIAKSIIEESGGKMSFKSEENKGSTFWFTLPIHSVK